VVSPHVLAEHGVGIDRQHSVGPQTKLREMASEADEPRVNTFLELASGIQVWPEGLQRRTRNPDLPESLTVRYQYASFVPMRDSDPPLSPCCHGRRTRQAASGSEGRLACVAARASRTTTRETGVPIGLLFNHTHLRLITPHAKSSGHLTFRFNIFEALGRRWQARYTQNGAGLHVPHAQRLPALLRKAAFRASSDEARRAGSCALWQLQDQRANDRRRARL
jgi:hypothetical protein